MLLLFIRYLSDINVKKILRVFYYLYIEFDIKILTEILKLKMYFVCNMKRDIKMYKAFFYNQMSLNNQ